MLISADWLNDFVDIKRKSPDELGQALTLSTAEVEGVSQFGARRDCIIEIDNKSLTHRPDLWGHFGIARELSAIYETALKDRFDPGWFDKARANFTKDASPVTIEVANDSACLGYFGLTIDKVEVKQSPAWMQERLEAMGLRPINNMVDIGNYVMLELGHPLHIFDRAQIHDGKIIIRALSGPAALNMLDGSTANLVAGDTVVADPRGALVLGGIMGGVASGVSDKTRSVFIEVANWKPAAVRRTSQRIGLRTDSSMRYEKTLDSRQMQRTIFRAAELILQLCPGARVAGKLEYDGPNLSGRGTLTVETSAANISALLGTTVTEAQVTKILTSLGFTVSGKDRKLSVTVPSFRATKDVSCEADLVEEVGRIIGYNNIVPRAPLNEILPVRIPAQRMLERRIQDFFVLHAGAFEIMTYPLIGEKILADAAWPVKNDALRLKNSWSPDCDRPRPSLIPSLLQALSLNQKTYEQFALFEIGRAYLPHEKEFREEHAQLGFALFHRESSCFVKALNWSERLCKFLGLGSARVVPFRAEDLLMAGGWEGRHPSQSQSLEAAAKTCGVVFSVTPFVLRNFKIRGHAALGIFKLESFAQRGVEQQAKFAPISRFPQTTFDCTVVAGARVSVDEVLAVVKNIGDAHITSVKLASVFEIPGEKNALCVRSFLSAPDRTLSTEDLKSLENRIVQSLAGAGFALKQR